MKTWNISLVADVYVCVSVCEYGCCVTQWTGMCDNKMHEWKKCLNARMQMSVTSLASIHNVDLIKLYTSFTAFDSFVFLLQAAGWCPESNSLEWSKG